MNFYDSIIEGAQELTVQERGQLYAACLEYLYYGREPDFPMKPITRAMFVMVRPVLDNQRVKQAAGSKGGRARAKRQADAKQRVSKPPSKTQADAKQNASKAQAEPKQDASTPPSGTQARLFPETQADAKQNASEQEQEQEREKPSPDGEGKKRPKRARQFVPPTVGDVERVARERHLTLVDPEAFWAHYDAQGWVNGNGVPIASWESKLISWNSAERLRRQERGGEGAYDATYD